MIEVREQIHEWSLGLPPWQRDLLRRLSEGPLAERDEIEVLRIALEHADAPVPRPVELADLPADAVEMGQVELREIRDVQNVNLLAEGQALRFKPGMNVLFGATGAGKSSYGRLLRRLCRPTETARILGNTFDASRESKRQTAIIGLSVDGEAREIAVDLASEPDQILSAIAVFDGSRAPMYVSEPTAVDHIPESLLLLRRLAEAQEVLRARLKERIGTLEWELRPPPGCSEAAKELLGSITDQTDMAEFERRVTLSDGERAELRGLDAALATPQASDGDAKAAALARARAAEKVADELDRAAESLSLERIESIADLRSGLDETVAAEHALAAEAFADQRQPGTGKGPWRAMWEAAQRFVESEGGTFPDLAPHAACPLCQQELSDGVAERMGKFEEFLRSDLRERGVSLARSLARTMDGLPDVAALDELTTASLAGAPAHVVAAASEAAAVLSACSELAHRCAKDPRAERNSISQMPPISAVRAYVKEQRALAEGQRASRGEMDQRRHAELRAREELAALMPGIVEYTGGLARIAQCKATRQAMGVVKISTQLRKLQKDAVTDRLAVAILEELKAIDLLAAEIDVTGKASGGRTSIAFGLRGSHDKAAEIISEGEQRAVALAFFLAERADAGGGAIVLDDPAALLDDERREYLASRLLNEAQRRQVIVLTHDLTFVQMLQRAARGAGRELHSQTLRRAYGRAGVLGDEGPLSFSGSVGMAAG